MAAALSFPSMRHRVSERILIIWFRSVSSKVLTADESGRSVSSGTLRTCFFVGAHSSRAVRSLLTSGITCDSRPDQLSMHAGQPTRSNPLRDE
jgi:hypothetical protein